MSLPPVVVDTWSWPSAQSGHRTQIELHQVRAADRYIEVAVHVASPGVEQGEVTWDGPCVGLTPDQARHVARDLNARADLVDALLTARAVHTEGVPF